jgi:hypothetical protein
MDKLNGKLDEIKGEVSRVLHDYVLPVAETTQKVVDFFDKAEQSLETAERIADGAVRATCLQHS